MTNQENTVAETTMKEYFAYLVELRDSGVTNMFGAAPYLQDRFGLDKYEARDVLFSWFRTFSE